MGTAENYHLKWDSHQSYLNMSVATLHKNEKFADVMLFSCSPDGIGPGGSLNSSYGLGIPAHKFILSSCSLFFASILESTLPSTNGIMYIVLPPELSRRAIQILVQYMYSGEATVSNDILKEVLRGGEILKIRGLCRSNTTTNKSNSNGSANGANINLPTNQQHPTTDVQPNPYPPSLLSTVQLMDHPPAATSTRYDLEPRQDIIRGLGASVLPKESPVIVKSPKPASHSTVLGPLTVNTGTGSQMISVNREVAIDPEDKCYYGCPPYSKSVCTVADCRKCVQPETQIRRYSEDVNMTENNAPQRTDETAQRTDARCRSVGEDLPIVTIPLSSSTKSFHSNSALDQDDGSNDNHRYSSIKSEPKDWQSSSSNRSPSQLSNTQFDKVKQEVLLSEDEDDHGSDSTHEFEEVTASELKCELCPETFGDPKEWVNHIQSHAEENESAKLNSNNLRTYGRGKRRRTSRDEDSVALLKCDVCSTFFSTPADWVRHIENKHTEKELAVVNSKHTPIVSKSDKLRQLKHYKRPKGSEFIDYLDKACEICGEKFQTYANMVIHKRTTHMGVN